MLDRLPESTLAIVTELRDLTIALEPKLAELPAGTPVGKTIGGRRYWYLQSRGGGLEVQRYLGPETNEIVAKVETWRRSREQLAPELAELARLNDMAVAGGVSRESAATTRVLELLAACGVFRRGCVLAGTRAFVAYGSLLGFRAPIAARTQDVDVAVGRSLALALPRSSSDELPERLSETEPPFLPVPDLDPRRPSTSFKVRGRELRVDFVTTRRSREAEAPVVIPALGIAAWPLELVDFLLEASILTVICGTRPVLVRVPDPSRFALHKLWLSAQRPSTESARAEKDLLQAQVLLEILFEERSRDLDRAATALRRRSRAFAMVLRQGARLPRELRQPLESLLRT